MDGAMTRGHPAALATIGAMIRRGAPGAVLIVGPAGIGKTTLALDLAAGLLCAATDPALRPDGSCRGCRLVAHGSHPDVHRLGPEGPGRQVVIGGPGKPRGIRDLIAELALLPIEGDARVAIIESAHRMNEDAQTALLKTLEEPPARTTIVLCADAEEPLLPTIRSRCARIRLGPVGVRDIESILVDLGAADPPLGARLARIADGRPGLALAWARQPDALRERDAIGRALLDLSAARPSVRLQGIRAIAIQAAALTVVADPPAQNGSQPGTGPRGKGRGASRSAPSSAADAAAAASASTVSPDASGENATPPPAQPDDEATVPTRAPATERRRAAEAIVSLWTDVARDLALCQRGLERSVRDLDRMDETVSLAADLDPEEIAAFLDRLGRAGVLLTTNVSPELVLDDLALTWPSRRRSAA
jgi:DNA polymerase III subunit delta'